VQALVQDPRERRGRRLPRQRSLADRFSDLSRHFVFEYYPWYHTAPVRHWDRADGGVLPVDIASNYMPRLGMYESSDRRTLEQHARWIAESGVGAINVSWWGRDSEDDRWIPTLMDVMAAHNIHVTFHIENYGERRASSYASDIQYLIAEYGDRRHWDCFLLLEHADGAVGPVFKSFATIVTPTVVDCHGVRSADRNFAPDALWRQQTDRVREMFRHDFDRITLLADSLDFGRTPAAGFDGIAIYDNFVRPDSWRRNARECSSRNLIFSFNINSGFDGYVLRKVDPGACYTPPSFEPGADVYDWMQSADRERAARASASRIKESLETTIALQTDPTLANAKHGFFLVYINSFNEWHEGDQFEPMKDYGQLTAEERRIGYHNPENGMYRLQTLSTLLEDVLDPA
jgi:hypothetical protein